MGDDASYKFHELGRIHTAAILSAYILLKTPAILPFPDAERTRRRLLLFISVIEHTAEKPTEFSPDLDLIKMLKGGKITLADGDDIYASNPRLCLNLTDQRALGTVAQTFKEEGYVVLMTAFFTRIAADLAALADFVESSQAVKLGPQEKTKAASIIGSFARELTDRLADNRIMCRTASDSISRRNRAVPVAAEKNAKSAAKAAPAH